MLSRFLLSFSSPVDFLLIFQFYNSPFISRSECKFAVSFLLLLSFLLTYLTNFRYALTKALFSKIYNDIVTVWCCCLTFVYVLSLILFTVPHACLWLPLALELLFVHFVCGMLIYAWLYSTASTPNLDLLGISVTAYDWLILLFERACHRERWWRFYRYRLFSGGPPRMDDYVHKWKTAYRHHHMLGGAPPHQTRS